MTGHPARPRFRGSRKHVLDWVESPQFAVELREMLQPVPVSLRDPIVSVPAGHRDPAEAQLYDPALPFGVLRPVQAQLREWWLEYPDGAKTPNWDLVVACEIEGTPGLILVEAKANVAELKLDGKSEPNSLESRSGRNHLRIRSAIAQARSGLEDAGVPMQIAVGTHYQLANRIAFTWKLATLGIPTVLVYLGFTGDSGISDVGLPLGGHRHWQEVLLEHAAPVVPEQFWGRRINVGNTSMWPLIRSLPVREVSASMPPRVSGGLA